MLNRFRSLLKQNKGLTLVEVLLVIVIIAIIYAVFSSRIGNPTDKARLVGVKNDFRNFELAVNTYEKWYSELPDINSATDLSNLLKETKLNVKTSIQTAGIAALGVGGLEDTLSATAPGVAGAGQELIANKVDPWDRFYRYYYFKPATSKEATDRGYIEGIVIVSPGPNKREDYLAALATAGNGQQDVDSMIRVATGKTAAVAGAPATAASEATYNDNGLMDSTSAKDDIIMVLWIDLEGSLKMRTFGLDKDVS